MSSAGRAWRAAFGSEPEQYGDVLDLLDSAAVDVDTYGKATAGEVAKLRQDTMAKTDKIVKEGKKGWGRRVDMYWEKYYAARNDAWRKFFDSAEQRWKIAERDVMMQSWQFKGIPQVK